MLYECIYICVCVYVCVCAYIYICIYILCVCVHMCYDVIVPSLPSRIPVWHESMDVGHLRLSCGRSSGQRCKPQLNSPRQELNYFPACHFGKPHVWYSWQFEITQNLSKHPRHCSIGWSQDISSLQLYTAPAFHGCCFETTQPAIEHRPDAQHSAGVLKMGHPQNHRFQYWNSQSFGWFGGPSILGSLQIEIQKRRFGPTL